ncbi:hypothetical protein [Paenibacillus sp. y28]|uniref:hypothetical protein n=1 Tax=Paenibacillus sp. y28 TaxID=3129110 RepID=UPI0030176920
MLNSMSRPAVYASMIRRYGLRTVVAVAIEEIDNLCREENLSEYIREQALKQCKKDMRLALEELRVH